MVDPPRNTAAGWPAWQPWVALAGFAFLVHFVWEMWQAPFYRTMLQADHVTPGRGGLLTDDAIILESGGIETRQEYRGYHLAGDIAVLKTVRGESGKLGVRV